MAFPPEVPAVFRPVLGVLGKLSRARFLAKGQSKESVNTFKFSAAQQVARPFFSPSFLCGKLHCPGVPKEHCTDA